MAQQSAEQPIKQKDDSPPAIIMPPQISSLGQCSLIMRMRIIDQVIKADPYILNNYFDDLLMKSSPLKQALFVLQAAAAEPGIAEQSVHDILTWKNSGYPFDFTELLNGYISFIKAGLKSTDSNYHYHYHKLPLSWNIVSTLIACGASPGLLNDDLIKENAALSVLQKMDPLLRDKITSLYAEHGFVRILFHTMLLIAINSGLESEYYHLAEVSHARNLLDSAYFVRTLHWHLKDAYCYWIDKYDTYDQSVFLHAIRHIEPLMKARLISIDTLIGVSKNFLTWLNFYTCPHDHISENKKWIDLIKLCGISGKYPRSQFMAMAKKAEQHITSPESRIMMRDVNLAAGIEAELVRGKAIYDKLSDTPIDKMHLPVPNYEEKVELLAYLGQFAVGPSDAEKAEYQALEEKLAVFFKAGVGLGLNPISDAKKAQRTYLKLHQQIIETPQPNVRSGLLSFFSQSKPDRELQVRASPVREGAAAGAESLLSVVTGLNLGSDGDD